jgi:selenide,water dikinase
MIDYKKRKRIMGRSLRLGHCVCNPKEACPCELFKQKNVCLCAGEREEEAAEDVPLTKLVENAGCASKISQNDLKRALDGLPRIFDPRVLVSADTCDDAGVFRLTKAKALVQSVDIFTPLVDDPYVFGQIAAANSVSDIYAMGGTPLTALSIVSFPIEKLSPRVMNKMLQGGIDKLREARTVVIGGHSIKDSEIKFGFAVTGLIDPSRIITNDKARPGDVLILTKPIGTGVISFAAQIGRASERALAAASLSMVELNKAAAEVAVEMGVRTGTDVTGFGLIGHLSEMAEQSRVTVEIEARHVPLLDEALDYVRRDIISGAIERNRESSSRLVKVRSGVDGALETILYDPQTSGGLLLAVPRREASTFLKKLETKGVKGAAVIGKATAKSSGRIVIR